MIGKTLHRKITIEQSKENPTKS